MQGAAEEAASEAPPVPGPPAEQAAAGSAEQAEAKFSFGAAFLGAPPAKGYTGPHEGVPEAWLLHFAKHHADAAVWSGLFTSGRGGGHFAVERARTLTVTLRLGGMHRADWPQQIGVLEGVLKVRGTQPTRLVVQRVIEEPHPVNDTLWVARVNELFSNLADCGQGITDVAFSIYTFDYRSHTDAAPVLHSLAAACPNPQTLSIRYDSNAQAVEFPDPSLWPKLTSLSFPNDHDYVTDPGRTLWSHIVPYMTQLTFLSLPECHPDVSPPWDVLFPSHSPTNLPLAHLTIDGTLTDELLSKLLTHAPNLAKLTVRDVQVGSDGFSDKEWGVGALEVMKRDMDVGLMAMLTKLPRPREGRMGVVGGDEVCLPAQGLDAHVAERLALWRFDNKRVALRYDGVPPADQPAALRRTLRQLADMQAPEATVWLQGWQWPAVADTVAECLPLLPHLQFGVHTDKPLTDQLLAVVLRMGPHMRCLYVYRLALQSDHSGVAWPWSVLSVEHLDIAQMLRLPQPGPGAQLRTCVFRLKHEAADTDRLQALLSSLQCSPRREPYDPPDRYTARVAKLQGSNVLAQLSLLKTMKLDKCTDAEIELQIIKCVLDSDTTQALSTHLPPWCGSLSFIHCTWPLNPLHYKALAQSIPPLHFQWNLVGGHTTAAARSMCEGAAERRRGAHSERKLLVFTDAFESYGVGKVCLCEYTGSLERLRVWDDEKGS